MNRILVFLILFFCFIGDGSAFDSNRLPLIMLSPSGDAKNVGRKLVEGYERAQTFKFAKALQEELQTQYGFRVILTRFPGEEIVDLQNASFSNRLGVDFYISLHLYRQDRAKPRLYLYHLVYNPMVDLAKRVFDSFRFVSIHQAHFMNIFVTMQYAKMIRDTLCAYESMFDVYGLYGIPLRFLCGIIAPAIAIEIGINQEDQWGIMVLPLVESLVFLMQNGNERVQL
jgi:hypothetical protein